MNIGMNEKIVNLIKKACKTADEDFIDIAISLVDDSKKAQIEKLTSKVMKLIPESGGEPDEDLLEIIKDLLFEETEPTKITVVQGSSNDYYSESFQDPIKTRKTRSVVVEDRPNLFDPNDTEWSSIGRDEDHQKHKAAHKPVKKAKAKNVDVRCSDCETMMSIPSELYLGESYGTKCNGCIG
jgi:hypothetical protein